MGKNQSSNMVVRIWMMPMGMKYDHPKFAQKVNSGGQEQPLQVADPDFKICQKYLEMPIF